MNCFVIKHVLLVGQVRLCCSNKNFPKYQISSAKCMNCSCSLFCLGGQGNLFHSPSQGPRLSQVLCLIAESPVPASVFQLPWQRNKTPENHSFLILQSRNDPSYFHTYFLFIGQSYSHGPITAVGCGVWRNKWDSQCDGNILIIENKMFSIWGT